MKKTDVYFIDNSEHTTQRITETVIEQKAPTDESVRLLWELEEAAEKRLIEKVRVENNIFNCVIHYYLDSMNDCLLTKVIFDLNGKREVVELSIPKHRKNTVHELMFNAISQRITDVFLNKAFSQLSNDSIKAACLFNEPWS